MKKLLLDSHALIWFFEEDDRLPLAIKAMIEDPENEVFVSIASFWEISIKKSLGKLTLGKATQEMIQECENQDIILLPIQSKELETLETLPFYHRDPFDRMIIATAVALNLEVLSADIQFDEYSIRRIWTI